MKSHTLKFPNGDVGVLNQLDDGSWACPICGDPWTDPPYFPNDGEVGSLRDFSTPSLGEICDGCDVEYGLDVGCSEETPPGWMPRVFMRHRIRWLNRVGWSAEALKQLRDNLGITEEEVRCGAEELKREGWMD